MEIKRILVSAPIMFVFDWRLPFEIMCDASDHAVEAVLVKRNENISMQSTMKPCVK